MSTLRISCPYESNFSTTWRPATPDPPVKTILLPEDGVAMALLSYQSKAVRRTTVNYERSLGTNTFVLLNVPDRSQGSSFTRSYPALGWRGSVLPACQRASLCHHTPNVSAYMGKVVTRAHLHVSTGFVIPFNGTFIHVYHVMSWL
jgi:hypothetical protein